MTPLSEEADRSTQEPFTDTRAVTVQHEGLHQLRTVRVRRSAQGGEGQQSNDQLRSHIWRQQEAERTLNYGLLFARPHCGVGPEDAVSAAPQVPPNVHVISVVKVNYEI
ncbi:hypothetical protein F7725_012703 [Dissostichus mawsoni]|uniref:Uncharacterized protein n=1 Tax=Dissostichus mawsoni TaxID=36200 RepID=A0A7J5YPN8_DISMA|nr:hypothetical protein F7725_012703 [Dissostichus mawsoni]